MSDKAKGRIQAALSVAAILLSLGAVGVSAGVYRERLDQHEARLNRIDQRVGALYMHFLGEDER